MEETKPKKPAGKWWVIYDTRRGMLAEKTEFFCKGHQEWAIKMEGPFTKEEARERKAEMNELIKKGELKVPGKREPKPKPIKPATLKMSDIFKPDEAVKVRSAVEKAVDTKKEFRERVQKKSEHPEVPRYQPRTMMNNAGTSTPSEGRRYQDRPKYHLVEYTRRPGEMVILYDLIQAPSQEEAVRIASEKGFIYIREMSSSFRESVGIAIFDLRLPTEALVFLRPKFV